jgi:hypothetical protein
VVTAKPPIFRDVICSLSDQEKMVILSCCC